jgi:hypothetical protein
MLYKIASGLGSAITVVEIVVHGFSDLSCKLTRQKFQIQIHPTLTFLTSAHRSR